MDNQTVSVITRTVDGRFDLLERAIFSVYCNDYKQKQAVIVYQGKDPGYVRELNGFKELYPGISFKVVQNPSNEDERAKNLNLGMANADGRYICFLDDDDVIYPNHLSKLIERIRDTGKAWAYSQSCIDMEEDRYIIKKEYKFLHSDFSYLNLFDDNYIPINTWMIDRDKVRDKSILTFKEDLKKLEDYGFLLKFAFHYEPAVCKEITSIYKIRTDGSNTTTYGMDENHPEYDKKDNEWKDARKAVQAIRDNLIDSHYWFREFLNINLEPIIKKSPRKLVNLKAKVGNKRLSISLEKVSNTRKKKNLRSLISLYLFKKTGLNQIEIFFRKKLRDPLLKDNKIMVMKQDLK